MNNKGHQDEKDNHGQPPNELTSTQVLSATGEEDAGVG